MNWGEIKYFNRSDFSEDGDLAAPDLIKALDHGRGILNNRMFPSPANGALARFGGSTSSQHYVGSSPQNIIRESTGSDMFIEGIPLENFLLLYQSGLFGGIGIYLDTTGPDGLPWILFHLDIRESNPSLAGNILYWFGIKKVNPITGKSQTVYRYPQIQRKYLKLFSSDKLIGDKIYNEMAK